MKEELMEQILEIIKLTKDFTLEQAPEVARQVLEYGYYSSWASVIICFSIFLIILMILGVVYFINIDDDDALWVTLILFLVFESAPFSILIINIFTIIQIKVAPKLYIIEQLGRLIN